MVKSLSDYSFPENQRIFIKQFSKTEWLLNGWSNKDTDLILNVYSTIALFVKNGNYLELGCGTGILCRFLYLFSNKRIKPYGIDNAANVIALAKRNNPAFADNFKTENYFHLLKSNDFNWNEFSLVTIFITNGEAGWERLREMLIPLIRAHKNVNFLIYAYDEDLLFAKEKYITNFISEATSISKISIASHSILVISENLAIHKIANNLRNHILAASTKMVDNNHHRKIIEGVITKKYRRYFDLKMKAQNKTDKTRDLTILLDGTCMLTKTCFFNKKTGILKRQSIK